MGRVRGGSFKEKRLQGEDLLQIGNVALDQDPKYNSYLVWGQHCLRFMVYGVFTRDQATGSFPGQHLIIHLDFSTFVSQLSNSSAGHLKVWRTKMLWMKMQ